MRLEHFTTSKGATVYVNPDRVLLVEAEGDATIIKTLDTSTAVTGSLEEVVNKLQGEESRFPR